MTTAVAPRRSVPQTDALPALVAAAAPHLASASRVACIDVGWLTAAAPHAAIVDLAGITDPEIAALPVADVVAANAHLYLWVPNALLPEGLAVMQGWGFRYVSNLVWAKRRKDGGPDGRGVGFYFRNVTEVVLFGVRGPNARTLAPGRRQTNLIATRKREHSRKPDELYPIVEACSPGPFLELFARHPRNGWASWGREMPAADAR